MTDSRHGSLSAHIVLRGWAELRLRLGYDIIKPFSDKTSGKFAILVQSVCGCQEVQSSASPRPGLRGHAA